MSDLSTVLKGEITRLAKKVVKQHLTSLQGASASHRQQLIALKRRLDEAEKELTKLRRLMVKPGPAEAPADAGKKIRFVAKGLKPLRTRLGLSARDFGLLVGVSEQSVYNWEGRKAVPQAAQIAKIAGLRQIGKREARTRLESLDRVVGKKIKSAKK